MKNRIWELDAARGLGLIGMIVIHLLFDLTSLTGVLSWQEPGWFLFLKNNGGALFLVISGISATLGHHPLKRGAQVLACGVLCTAVTYGMYRLGLATRGIVIYFGVLQCLGVCMLLWCPVQRWRPEVLLALGLVLAAAGLYLSGRTVDAPFWLIPFGFCPEWFVSSDYFPLLPNFGWFLVGAWIGKRVYGDKKTKFPQVNETVFRPLCVLGRHSLPVYLLHQPVLGGLAMLIARMAG